MATIRAICLYVVVAISLLEGRVYSSSCVCENADLCRPLPLESASFGFYGFATDISPGSYKQYNWTKLSTIIVAAPLTNLPELICYARARNVRVTLLTDIGINTILSPQETAQYVKDAVKKVQDNNLDGLNMDFEGSIQTNSSAYYALTSAMAQLRTGLKNANANYSLSMDYVNCAQCIPSRTYDYMNLMNVIDYFILMDYDMQGSMVSRYERVEGTNLCKASSNSPFPIIYKHTEEFLSLGVPPSKLVIAFPWYGYLDSCEVFDHSTQLCYTDCSNMGNGKLQRQYKDIMTDLRQLSSEGRQFNTETLTATLTYIGADGTIYQLNYDDPWTLKIKYGYVLQRKLRGASAWTMSFPGNGTSVQETADRELMWSVIPDRLD